MNKVVFKIFAALVLALTITSCAQNKDEIINDAVSQLNARKTEIVQAFGIPGATFEARNDSESLVCEFTIPTEITDEMITAFENLPKSQLTESLKKECSESDIQKLKEAEINYVFIVTSSSNGKQAVITINTSNF